MALNFGSFCLHLSNDLIAGMYNLAQVRISACTVGQRLGWRGSLYSQVGHLKPQLSSPSLTGCFSLYCHSAYHVSMETQALSLPIHLPSLFLHFWSLSKAPALSSLASFIIFISTHSCIYFSFCLSCPFPGYPCFSQRGFKLQISLHTALTTYHLNVFCVSSPDSGI